MIYLNKGDDTELRISSLQKVVKVNLCDIYSTMYVTMKKIFTNNYKFLQSIITSFKNY